MVEAARRAAVELIDDNPLLDRHPQLAAELELLLNVRLVAHQPIDATPGRSEASRVGLSLAENTALRR